MAVNWRSTMRDLLRPATLKRAAVIMAVVLTGVEILITLVYWQFGIERLLSEMVATLFFATASGLPVSLYVSMQHERLRHLSRVLTVLSSTDRMTGLLNRQTFVEQLELALFEGRKTGAGVLAYIDADHFKTLNDRFGHALGDEVILLLAAHLRQSTRDGDLCGRLGGEEFGIFLRGSTLHDAATIADRLRAEIELAGLRLARPGLSLSVSIGLAAHRPGKTAAELMQDADRSLYAAKGEGRNTVVVELKRYRAA